MFESSYFLKNKAIFVLSFSLCILSCLLGVWLCTAVFCLERLVLVVVWCNSSTLVFINEVNLCRAQLVLGWVTMSGFISWCRTFILVCNQPLRSTQPGHSFVGRCNE